MNKRYHIIIILIIILAVSMMIFYNANKNMPTFTKNGYGGYSSSRSKNNTNPTKPIDPLQPALDAYDAGNYKQAEASAQQIVDTLSKSKDPENKKIAVKAREVLAYSAARRKDMKLAKERFSIMKEEASKLPDKGKQDEQIGQMEPTLTENAAYQHAVCTSALGDKKAAEAEYFKFMKDYPESPLVHGAIKRIRQLHDGKLTKEMETAFNDAMQIVKDKQMQRMRDASRCGPECIAELLKRKGMDVDVPTLAKEMKSNEQGTTLQALSDVAQKYGFTPKGLELTQKGLVKQSFPLIALVSPGHYIIVEDASMTGVTISNPSNSNNGKPQKKKLPISEWNQMWQGIVLALK